jgi:hypothetical protein
LGKSGQKTLQIESEGRKTLEDSSDISGSCRDESEATDGKENNKKWESFKPVSRTQYSGHYGILHMTSILNGFDEILCVLCGKENTILFISVMN